MTLLVVFLLCCALGVVGWFVWKAYEFDIFMQVWDEQKPIGYIPQLDEIYHDMREAWTKRYSRP